jgi:hypothetical protein
MGMNRYYTQKVRGSRVRLVAAPGRETARPPVFRRHWAAAPTRCPSVAALEDAAFPPSFTFDRRSSPDKEERSIARNSFADHSDRSASSVSHLGATLGACARSVSSGHRFTRHRRLNW